MQGQQVEYATAGGPGRNAAGGKSAEQLRGEVIDAYREQKLKGRKGATMQSLAKLVTRST